jgi:class 3 adenylate cyclase/tetratricopeptide (TPR) repeat protein
MSFEEQRLEAGIAALEAQRAQLGDEVVDAALRGLQVRLAALRGVTLEPAQALRQVSILFLDVVGSTSLGQHLDPEAIGTLMDGMLARGSAIVEAHRGRVLQYAGDSLLAAFGADEAAEDDAERAVRCGLALLELGASLRAEVEVRHGFSGTGVRIGIHTGGVLLGGGVDKDGSIRGQAVNVAARMEQTAPPGALRISHDTYRQVRGVFDVEAQPPLVVKGVDVPVRSYLVLRAKPRAFRMTTRGIEGVETRMIGRDAELASLQTAFVRLVESGAGLQHVLIVSEAGVGKSRLLNEFETWSEARTKRCLLFQARATPQMRAQPYGLVRDLFAWRWQILDGDSPDVARGKLESALLPLFAGNSDADAGAPGDAESNAHLLGQLLGFGYDDSRHIRGIRDDPQQIRNRGFHAAAQALRRLAEREDQPIVMLLDDLHWADDGSLDFIDHLAQVDRDVPMLIVSLTRPTLFERRGMAASIEPGVWSQRIDLQPLGVAESRRLVSELLQKLSDIPNELNDLLTSRGSGNPFYMEELVKMLIDQGAIATIGERWSLDADRLRTLRVPPTLTGVLQARLDGLPAAERRALQLASVIGMTFWDSALMHVDVEAPAHLPALRARALIEPKEVSQAFGHGIREHAFAHQILHQVTYDTVLRRSRQGAHARAADWIVRHIGILGKRLLAVAAEHYERAGDTANAGEYYARAAAYMVETFAHVAAVESSTRGLEIVAMDDVEPRWRLLDLREQALQKLGRSDPQRADIDALAVIADATPAGAPGDLRRAEVARRRSDFAHRIGDWPMQEREARRCRDLAAAAGDETLFLRGTRRLAEALAFQGDPSAGRRLAEAALARARVLGLERVESGLIVALTVCTDALGDRVAGLELSLQDLALNRRSSNPLNEAVASSNVGMSYLAFGAFAEARGHLEDALRMHRRLGNREIEGNTCSVLSELAWREGDAPLALKHAQAAWDIALEGGRRLYQTDALWSLGNARLALGRWEEADDAFARSCALASEIRSVPQVLNALDGRARVALAQADTAQAGRLIEHLLQQAASAVPRNNTGAMSGSFPLSDDSQADHNPFAGAYEQLIRLTMFRIWSRLGDSRAGPLLTEAYARLMAEADRMRDADLRQCYLMQIAEHREIQAAACEAHLRCK